MMTGMPSYADLLAQVRPRSIQSEDDANSVQREIDRLVDLPVRTTAEDELLGLLGDLLSVWESAHVTLPSVPVGSLIGALLEARGLSQQALAGPVFGHRSAVSEVIHGKRSLTYGQVQKLARFFDLSPAVFFPTSMEGD